MKPELTGLAVLTSLCSFFLASDGVVDVWRLVWTGVGTLLVGGGAGALNQFYERDYDALMKRTERRPIPSGRLSPSSAFVFGNTVSLVGLIILVLGVNALSAFLAALTLITYLFLYTPLKRVTWLNTKVGAIPGALPTLIGWAAAADRISIGGWILFGILFIWQMPHFLSLAWVYRKDYARAGYKMLPVMDRSGRNTSLQIMAYCLLLVVVAALTSFVGLTGRVYLVCSVFLGTVFLVSSIQFTLSVFAPATEADTGPNKYSRRIFLASLLYLPLVMTVMALDKV